VIVHLQLKTMQTALEREVLSKIFGPKRKTVTAGYKKLSNNCRHKATVCSDIVPTLQLGDC